MRFKALQVALDVISLLRRLLPAIRTRDSSLANQIRNAASSVALNLGEGNPRRGRDRIHFFNIAAGSLEETRTALLVAIAWGYISKSTAGDALERIDLLQAILWRLRGE